MFESIDVIYALLVLFGSLLQSIIGFGMGVLTIPIFIWLGMPLHHSVALLVPCVFFQTLVNSTQNREKIPWRHLVIAFIPRVIGLFFGILILRYWLAESKHLAALAVGVGIWLILIMQFVRPMEKPLGTRSLVPVGALSGLGAGVIGMGGPPLVFWVASQVWSVKRQRAFLWGSFMTVVPIQAMLLVQQFGASIVPPLLKGVLMVPVILIGALIGNRLGNSLSKQKLRNLMYGFLAIIACRLVISGLVELTPS